MYQEFINQLQNSIAPMNSDELKDLLNNDEMLDAKVDEVLEPIKAEKDNLLTENRQRAERNLEKEPQIIELRGQVTELADQAKEQCQSVQDKLAAIKEKSGGASQETTLALLQTAAAESEEETEALVKKFTDKDVDVEQFLEAFLTARTKMHLRKLKAEKMQELMRRQAQAAQRGGGVNSGGGGYNYPANSNSGFFPTSSGSSNVPYPMGPMMPMPPPRPY